MFWLYVPNIRPAQILFEPGEPERINRARLAMLLHKLPSEIDAEPYENIVDILAVQDGEAQARQLKAK